MAHLLELIVKTIVNTNAWKKFVDVKVRRGLTAWPRSAVEQRKYGVRYDFDGEKEVGGTTYNKFQMQANAGKVPANIGRWRAKHGGTHGVMADVYVRKDGNREDVRAALEKAHKGIDWG